MDKNNAPPPLYTAQGKPAGRIRQKNEDTNL
ncbi:TetR/AcrR family transcriptional regulator, partial [Stutzerimonas stutzeri]